MLIEGQLSLFDFGVIAETVAVILLMSFLASKSSWT